MTHFRKIVFDLIEQGLSDTEIVEAVRKEHKMELTLPRVKNYREVFKLLEPSDREKYVRGTPYGLSGRKL
jgi:hypothetical protein